ncbi:hypothetical protein [Bacillus sp. 1NLA3E]|uniref:hypothetical protein n=1 Tax=Bacillus sp. 1NLA3E TaxID=666686 RepID=UPI000247F41B|nr:hypothetical protein [Bacillus sp. 1NLA3E]
MTAEICVMNTIGVAMAADSAVTIGSGTKIYNSANKLFTLSKFHPVGIMIYGNAEFLRVPWETIIKVYRQSLDVKTFPTVEEYSYDFLHFLKGNNYMELTSEVEEYKFILNLITESVSSAFDTILGKLKARVNEKPDSTEDELNAVANTYLDELLMDCDNKNFINGFDDQDYRQIIEKYGDQIEKIIIETFENMIFSEHLITNLKYIVANNLIKQFSRSTSGIVIAGFGEQELYPSLFAYNIDGRINNKLKYQLTTQRVVGTDFTAAIVPFAQDDMVHTFVRGINPEIEGISSNYLGNIFKNLSNVIVEQLLDNLKNPKDSPELIKIIDDQLMNIFDKFNQSLDQYKQEHFTTPILNIVNSLPKDELAEMAESLVNLTSFKRRVSSSLETVGGPVDVAVITKGDGLIWIKRKHYFKQELNQQFAQNYFRRD